MGLIRLRRSDLSRAELSTLGWSGLDHPWPGDAGAHALSETLREEAASEGVRIVHKRSSRLRLSKMSTTYYGEIRLGANFRSLEPQWQATVLAHEIFHMRQWRYYGRWDFGRKYVFSARFRWAIEVQAYRESVRAILALGAGPDLVTEYIRKRPDVLWENYGLKALRKRDVYANTVRILTKTRRRTEKELTPTARER